MGDPEKAYHYASRHLEISKETGDRMGQATAQVNKKFIKFFLL
jgi:G-protein signaling modulator 2